MSWSERPDGDLTFTATAREYQVLDKTTRKVKRTAPFKGYFFCSVLGHYVPNEEPKYDKETEDLALCYG